MAKKGRKNEKAEVQETQVQLTAEQNQEWLKVVATRSVERLTREITEALTRIAQDLRKTADAIEADLKAYGPIQAAGYSVHRIEWLFPNLNLHELLETVAEAKVYQGHLYVMKELGLDIAKVLETEENR